MIDSNVVLRSYLASNSALTAIVGARIISPRLTEGMSLPAVSFFTRSGMSNPYIPLIINPSVQIDCWAANSITARQVYRAVYDALQGIQDTKVTIGAVDYYILSAIEEVQGQDLVDAEMPNYFRVLTFFNILVR